MNDQTGNAGTGPAESNDGTTSYLQDANGNTNREMFSLDNGTIPGGSTINGIKISAPARQGGNPKPKVRLSYQRIGTDGSPVDGSSVTANGGCCGYLAETTWSGLGWTTADLDSLEIGLTHTSGNVLYFSQIYVKVYYVAGGGGGATPTIVSWREIEP